MVKNILMFISGLFLLVLMSSFVHAAVVDLAWDPPEDGGEVEGYVVYGSATSGDYSDPDIFDVVQENSATISVNDKIKFYFIVKAYNCAGFSEASNEISWSYASIYNITYSVAASSVTIKGSNNEIVSAINIYVDDIFYDEITPSGSSWSYTYSSKTALAAGTVFELVPVDSSGEESSKVIIITIPESLFNVLTKTIRNGIVGNSYSLTLEADTDAKWSIADGSLPDGLTLVNGVISGIPAEGSEGDYTFTVSSTDDLGLTVTALLTLTIDPSDTTEIGLIDAVNGSYVTLSSSAGTINNLQGQDPSSLSPPAGYNFNYGVFKFQINGLDEGGSATVTFNYETAITEDISWYWYDAETGIWADISDSVNLTVSDTQISVTLTDGGAGDSDDISGHITDPSGPAFPSSNDTSDTSDTSDDDEKGESSGGCFIAAAAHVSLFESQYRSVAYWVDIALMIVALTTAFVVIYNGRRRNPS